jgi:hypothetical protein
MQLRNNSIFFLHFIQNNYKLLIFPLNMVPETLLNCRRLPCRLKAEKAAALIGCLPHDIPILTRAGLMKPLGFPAANCREILQRRQTSGEARRRQVERRSHEHSLPPLAGTEKNKEFC